MENDNTVQDDKPGDNSQVRSDDSGDDTDISDVSSDSREYVPSIRRNPLRELLLNSKRNGLETHGSSEITIHNSIDINKDSEVNSTKDVDSIGCSSGAQQNYDDLSHVSMLQEKEDYFGLTTGSELNVPKQESTGISSNEGHLIHILKQSENESVNEMFPFTDEYQLSTDDPEVDENSTLQNDVQNKQIPETDSQLPLPPENDEIKSNECTFKDVSYSNANDKKIPLTHSASHIVNLLSDLSMETPGQANDNLEDKLPNSIKSGEVCNLTSHSSDVVIPVPVCNNTSINAFPSSTFTKKMSFVSADDKPKVSFSFPSSTGPDLSFGINKAFSNLPASKNTFHVKTSFNSDGPFKFKISSLNNGNYSSIDAVSKTMPNTSTSNMQNPTPGNSASNGSSSLSFSSTLSPSTYGHTATSTDVNNFQHVNSPDSRPNNVSQCCQTTSPSMNTFSTISQNPFSSPFNDTFLMSDTGKSLSVLDKKTDVNNTNPFPGFSCTTTSFVSSSPVFHFSNQSNTAKIVFRRPAVRTSKLKSLPKSYLELFAQNNRLLTSRFSGVSKDKPNFCFGSMEQQTSKKSNAETTPGSIGVGLFGDCHNKPNLSSGSTVQTTKKSNEETAPGSFGVGLFGNSNNKPNLCFGSTEQQSSKKSNPETATGPFGVGLFGDSHNKPNLSSGSTEQTTKKSNAETVPGSFGVGLFGNSNNKPNLCFGSTEQQSSKKSNTETASKYFGVGLFGNSNKPYLSFGSTEQHTSKKSNAETATGHFGVNLCFGSTEQQTSKKSNAETATGPFGVNLCFGSTEQQTSKKSNAETATGPSGVNLCFGSTEQQSSKKSNTETASRYFGVGLFGNGINKPNLCFGSTEQQSSKKSNTETASRSFGVGLFGNSYNKPNLSFGSTEQQTSKKSNADTATGPFGVGSFRDSNNKPYLSFGPTEHHINMKSNSGTATGYFGVGLFGNSNNNLTFGSTEQQTSKNSTIWNGGSNFDSQGTATMFKFGESCKFPNDAFYGQRPDKKFEPRPERRWTSPACNESGDTSNKPEIPFRVVKGSDVVVKFGVTKTIEVHHQHITAMLEYSSLSFEELRFQHSKYNGKPLTATRTTSNKRIQTTDSSLLVEKYLNKMWKVLECPVCLEITMPPVLQCEQGHHVCSSCWEKVPSCPLCKRRRSQSRNYVAEALVEKLPLPCKYRVDGCMKTMCHLEKQNHEDLCAYRMCYCLADGCNQACNFKAMTVHLKDSHSHLLSGILFCASKREKFSWTLLKPVLQSLVHAFDIPDWGLFLLRQRRSLPNTYIWMEIMRFDASDTGFCYTVEASDSTQVRSITYKGLVLPLNSDTQDCLVIPRHYVNNLRHDVGFRLKISIWRS